jgi:hypothetical protein
LNASPEIFESLGRAATASSSKPRAGHHAAVVIERLGLPCMLRGEHHPIDVGAVVPVHSSPREAEDDLSACGKNHRCELELHFFPALACLRGCAEDENARVVKRQVRQLALLVKFVNSNDASETRPRRPPIRERGKKIVQSMSSA